ncbi:unnamed protein product [Candidula unifasciata]|uniref:RCC1 domain-containing protein 1 n=1 Tax=Candidula unifasciata TaxID=100452 RepID=A0A8S3ZE93_9EUPU|nr:unnamed protein product [Candidula unifasciata]
MALTLYGCGHNGFSQLDGFKCLKFNELGLCTSDKCTRIKPDKRTKIALPEQLFQLNEGYSLHKLLITWARLAATLKRDTNSYTSVITGFMNMTAQEAGSCGEASILDGQVVMASTDTDILLGGSEDTIPDKIIHEKSTASQSIAVLLPSTAARVSLVCGGHHHVFAVYDSVTVGKLHVSEDEFTKNDDGNTKENTEETHFDLHSIDSGVEVTEISCGKEHVLILAHVGTVFSYGLGSRGQLGHYSVEPEISPRLLASLEGLRMRSICAGGWHSASVSDCGDVYMWGWNESGQLGVPALSKAVSSSLSAEDDEDRVGIQTEPLCITSLPDELNVAAVACGSRHSVILSDTGRVFSCGWNTYGQLGLGDTENRDTFTEVVSFRGLCVEIYAGQWNSFFLCNPNKHGS